LLSILYCTFAKPLLLYFTPHPPKIRFEQYPTSFELAASIVSFAVQEGDLGPGRTALDLGCGTGMLAAGCAVVGCDAVLGVECDPDALAVAVANVEGMELSSDTIIEFLLAKVSDEGFIIKKGNNNNNNNNNNSGGGGKSKGRGRGRQSQQQQVVKSLDPNAHDGLPLRDNCVDTVVTNPPFGTKHNAGMDIRFLKCATRLASRAVYSFHKTSTRHYLLTTLATWGYEARVVAELKFDIPATYKFHTKQNVDIAVDLIRVSIITGDDDDDDDDDDEVEEEEVQDEEEYQEEEELVEY
jgi:predicted RNA methylase